MFVVIIALFVACITRLFLYWYKRDSRLPPGPRGIPMLGVTPFLGKQPAKTLMEWTKKYGKAYTVRLGNQETVILTDYEDIYDVHIRQTGKMGARPPFTVFDAYAKGQGIVFATPDVIKVHRPFTLHALRSLGVGKSAMENRIHQETTYLIQSIREKKGKSFSPKNLFLYVALNISCSNFLGERYSYDDKTLKTTGTLLIRGLRDNGMYILLTNTCSYLASIPPFKNAMKGYVDDMHRIADLAQEKIQEHRDSYDENDLRDYIDIFLREMKKEDHHLSFNESQLKTTLFGLLEAGSQTLSCTLQWCMIALLNYPKYHKLMEKEVNNVVGCGKKVSIADRKNMPYTQAFLYELMRKCTLVKIFDSCSMVDGVEVNGYKLPKNTGIYSIAWAVHNDPRFFPEPEKFKPERFIDPVTGTFQKSKYWIPFAIGKRNCLGEQLAQMELFIVVVTLIQNFDISIEDGAPLPSLDDGIEGVLYTPPPIKLLMTDKE
uniref:cytochrome P450 2C3-like n=1 Tax=Styela clava TaxID=7725 RepID=UPI001939F4A7|nr:cytochrome P450 2C3-like [Styela clava]